ncbi:lysozyme P-like [Zeugodacus cucurbitae]|uniref:lysozyme P-like n=1 Tax=Zeugodacus cucurbitae TaxID=28588 RepID=UPI000596A436|nr:lysozyme P-like [Zeugodacus cucurbitae]
MKIQLVALFLAIALHSAQSRIFDKCSLTHELAAQGIPRANIPNWVCIAQYESNFNTAEVGPPNPDGSRDWGIFHINDRYWCKPADGRPSANSCRVPCRSLYTDDITAAVKCARQIIRTQGFTAWNTWNTNCGRGANVPKIDDCY